jgi:hypothetical protein
VKFCAIFLARPESHILLIKDSMSSTIQEESISPFSLIISKISSLENLESTSLNFSKIIFLI